MSKDNWDRMWDEVAQHEFDAMDMPSQRQWADLRRRVSRRR